MVPWVGLQYVMLLFPDNTYFFILNCAGIFGILNDEIYHAVVSTGADSVHMH